jgi:hypothetical protein
MTEHDSRSPIALLAGSVRTGRPPDRSPGNLTLIPVSMTKSATFGSAAAGLRWRWSS